LNAQLAIRLAALAKTIRFPRRNPAAAFVSFVAFCEKPD